MCFLDHFFNERSGNNDSVCPSDFFSKYYNLNHLGDSLQIFSQQREVGTTRLELIALTGRRRVHRLGQTLAMARAFLLLSQHFHS